MPPASSQRPRRNGSLSAVAPGGTRGIEHLALRRQRGRRRRARAVHRHRRRLRVSVPQKPTARTPDAGQARSGKGPGAPVSRRGRRGRGRRDGGRPGSPAAANVASVSSAGAEHRGQRGRQERPDSRVYRDHADDPGPGRTRQRAERCAVHSAPSSFAQRTPGNSMYDKPQLPWTGLKELVSSLPVEISLHHSSIAFTTCGSLCRLIMRPAADKPALRG